MAFSQTTITIPQKTIIKIVTGITSGSITKHWRDGRRLTYIAYSLPTGSPAPNETTIIKRGIDIFPDGSTQAKINSDDAIDIYIYANIESVEDTENGKIILVVNA
jgi:hypothetical protein